MIDYDPTHRKLNIKAFLLLLASLTGLSIACNQSANIPNTGGPLTMPTPQIDFDPLLTPPTIEQPLQIKLTSTPENMMPLLPIATDVQNEIPLVEATPQAIVENLSPEFQNNVEAKVENDSGITVFNSSFMEGETAKNYYLFTVDLAKANIITGDPTDGMGETTMQFYLNHPDVQFVINGAPGWKGGGDSPLAAIPSVGGGCFVYFKTAFGKCYGHDNGDYIGNNLPMIAIFNNLGIAQYGSLSDASPPLNLNGESADFAFNGFRTLIENGKLTEKVAAMFGSNYGDATPSTAYGISQDGGKFYALIVTDSIGIRGLAEIGMQNGIYQMIHGDGGTSAQAVIVINNQVITVGNTGNIFYPIAAQPKP